MDQFLVGFNFTLTAGDIAQAALAAIALVDEVANALAEAAHWSTRLAPGVPHGVTLRSLPPTAARQVLDPLGQLVVEQQVAPLNTVATWIRIPAPHSADRAASR